MKKLMIGFMAFVSLFVMTGCIDFMEDITYHRDGSGTYEFLVDMGAMKEMMDAFGGMGDEDSEEGNEMKESTEKISESFDEMKEKLGKIKGISNYSSINDTATYKFGFKFDFKNVDALNAALKDQNPNSKASGNNFKGKKKYFERFNEGSLADAFKDEITGSEEGSEEDMAMVKSMFSDMKIRTTYHFDRKVKKASNPNARISSDGKTVVLDYFFFKDDQPKEGLGSSFKLK